jgi:D-aspartate ligase
MRFPCILKPPDSKSPRWMRHTHIKAFEVNDVAECEGLYDRHKDATDVFVLQEMVRGGDEAIHTCYGYYDAATEPLIEFTSRKLRQWPIRSGVGCLAEEIRQEAVRETANRLLKPLGFHGLCSLEMKRDSEDGKFYIIEANIGRPTGRAAHVEGCGVEMLLTLYCDLVGLPLPDERYQPFEGRKWINIRSDALAAISYWRLGELTLPEWYRSVRGVSSFALFSWRDPRPFVTEIRRTILRGTLRRTIWRDALHGARR